MSDLQIEKVLSPDQVNVDSGNFKLWIWYADKIPPHIGCSCEKRYFSLKVSGRDLGIPVDRVLEVINRKKIAFLLVDVDYTFEPEKLKDRFMEFNSAEENGPTCLTPITRILNSPDEIEQLSSLLTWLQSLNKILKVQGVYLPEGYSGLPVYGNMEIRQRLFELSLQKTNFSR